MTRLQMVSCATLLALSAVQFTIGCGNLQTERLSTREVVKSLPLMTTRRAGKELH